MVVVFSLLWERYIADIAVEIVFQSLYDHCAMVPLFSGCTKKSGDNW